ncbi:hypothetical protein SLE2022_177300 [Rubroshorea leprosula]
MDHSDRQNHFVQHLKNSISMSNFTVFGFLSIGFLYFFIWSPSISNPFSSFPLYQNINCPHHNSSFKTIKFPIDELELALEEASMANKTVIIAVVNRAYVEQGVNAQTTMLDLFTESLWLGEDTRPLLDHLLLVAVDQTAYDRCRFKRLHCYRLVTEGVDFGGEKVYMSKDFVKMMWRRTFFLLEVLKRGYSFIFTDMDVMWLRNPFSRLNHDDTVNNDLQISVDKFNGDPQSEKNMINTGFYYVRANSKTVSLFALWYSQKDNSTGKKEQDVLLELMRAGVFGQMELRVRFLDTRFFSGFCQDSNDVRAVTTVHANCCRHISAKLRDLATVLRDWKKFKMVVEKYGKVVARNQTWNFQWSGHSGCWNSWKINNNNNITKKPN